MHAALSKDVRSEGLAATRVWTATTPSVNNNSIAPVQTGLEVATNAAIKSQRHSEAVSIAMIDDRVLLRECFAKGIEAAQENISVSCFSTIDEWQAAAAQHPAVSLVLLCRGSRAAATVTREIEALTRGTTSIPVILVSDEEDAEAIQKAINLGARGFIPASVNLGLAVMAMQLVKAGGIYLPESLLWSPTRLLRTGDSDGKRQGLFTERQAAVVEALRQGMPNKIIAYELSMRESTVKVHIRNIMKKLKAKNRTEVAFLTKNLF